MPTKSPALHGRRYAKVEQAAAYIGVNPATIRVMLTDGRLTRYQLGDRIIRVDLNEIDEAMSGQNVERA